jgi:hypothetical protein
MDGLAAQGVDYPTLQYDGPFADAETAHYPVSGEPVSYEQAQQIAVDFVGAARVVDAAHGSDHAGRRRPGAWKLPWIPAMFARIGYPDRAAAMCFGCSASKSRRPQTISDQQAQLAAQNFSQIRRV